jgi:hypothetical protein
MSKAEKYQRFAEACLEIANAAKDDGASLVAAGGESTKRGRKRRSRLALAFPLSLNCQLSPSLRHFVKNTLMTLSSGLIGQPVA